MIFAMHATYFLETLCLCARDRNSGLAGGPDKLQYVTLPFIPHQQCDRGSSYAGKVYLDSMFCAGEALAFPTALFPVYSSSHKLDFWVARRGTERGKLQL